jgi:hypothetical protein
MADFDLTQTDAQVQSILNDAQDAQGAGAQTTLTTDYIMLKGTNGRYHKILKDSFTEAVRNVLAGLLVNNDKGTTISQIPAISSGDFGSVTPANLALVLGGVFTLVQSNTTLESCKAYGIYRVDSTATAQTISDCPERAGGTLVVSPALNGNFVRQEYQTRFNTYVRNCTVKDGIAPTAWVKYEGVEMQS